MTATRRELLCAAWIAVLAPFALGLPQPHGVIEVTYYYLPNSASSEKIKLAVSGLESEYKGGVRGRNLDATTEKNRKLAHKLGFESHGVVVRSTDGTVLWKQADQDVKMEDLRRELDRLTHRD